MQGDSGVSVVQVQGLIDNKDQLPYELRRADGAVVIIPANAVVFTPPAEVAVRWDRAATGNPYIPTARDEVAEPENVAIEGATEVAVFMAGFVGASPDRVNVLLPLLAFLFAAAGAAFIMVPLGFSPPSMLAGGIVFVAVWTVGGMRWFGIPPAMALTFPALLSVVAILIVRNRRVF